MRDYSYLHSPENVAKAVIARRMTMLAKPFDEKGRDGKRQQILFEQNNVCAKCHNAFEWEGEPLQPEFHHKDGNRSNEARENLEALCPNCHSQTSTDRFKGRKHTKETKLKIGLRFNK